MGVHLDAAGSVEQGARDGRRGRISSTRRAFFLSRQMGILGHIYVRGEGRFPWTGRKAGFAPLSLIWRTVESLLS